MDYELILKMLMVVRNENGGSKHDNYINAQSILHPSNNNAQRVLRAIYVL